MLGQGVYDVQILNLDGEVIDELNWSRLSYGRRLTNISDASAELLWSHGLSETVSQLVQAPWEHRLKIWRSNEMVWTGPTIVPQYGKDTASVAARDNFSWFERRQLEYDR